MRRSTVLPGPLPPITARVVPLVRAEAHAAQHLLLAE